MTCDLKSIDQALAGTELRKHLWALWRSKWADPILKEIAHLAWQQAKHLQDGTGGPLLPKAHKRVLRAIEKRIIEHRRKSIKAVK